MSKFILNLIAFFHLFLDDPFERVDLSDIYPNLVRDLSAKLNDFILTTVDPLNPPTLLPDPKSNPKYFGDKWSPGMIIFTLKLIVHFINYLC